MELGKVRISLPVSLSALTGYVLMTGRIGADGWLLTLGVFLMSCSSGALNHLQEYKTDALMPRTKNRPIPSGRISTWAALGVSLGFFAAGMSILIVNFIPIAFIASFLTLLSYNAVYTPLKKITAFAVVPGSLVGALPPYIGWLAAHGSISDTRIFWVALFFFIGQIPHFWLLLLMFGKEYSLAGYPTLRTIFSESQIKRLSFTWILATIGSALIIALKIMQGHTASFILLFYIFYLLFSLSVSLFIRKNLEPRPAFFKLNFLYLLMMVFLITDAILHT
ncbi:MAG: protoheme IX farnesyltransferase [Prolixibacteraceae bacterium]|jgi:protoheme IX farnesyltransferase|nr:protoheme IX farnesyltransferase [Prolixibacteraceae bacterium]